MYKWKRDKCGDYVATINGHSCRVHKSRIGWTPTVNGKIAMGVRETYHDAREQAETMAEIMWTAE